jgi:hypothetical protein
VPKVEWVLSQQHHRQQNDDHNPPFSACAPHDNYHCFDAQQQQQQQQRPASHEVRDRSCDDVPQNENTHSSTFRPTKGDPERHHHRLSGMGLHHWLWLVDDLDGAQAYEAGMEAAKEGHIPQRVHMDDLAGDSRLSYIWHHLLPVPLAIDTPELCVLFHNL